MLEQNLSEENTLNTSEGESQNSTEKKSVLESTENAVKEIEEIVADTSEKEDTTEPIKKENYTNLNLNELVEKLQKLLKQPNIKAVKENVNGIKDVFNEKFATLISEKKQSFLDQGGNAIDFQFQSPVKATFNSLIKEYKNKQQQFFKAKEKELTDNLVLRNEVIDDLKKLIEIGDNSTMYKSFRNLQDRWKLIGPVSKTRYNDTWKIYHHHVERFYDLLHISNDLRDLDFKHNLDKKLKLIDKVEKLSELNDVNIAFNELQKIHKEWKEEIGPVAREFREDIWNKFSASTKVIHNKKHQYYKELRSEFQDNIDKKLAVIQEIENFDTSTNKTHSDWQKSINEIELIRNKFFKLGKVPRSKSEEIWTKFKNATKVFNKNKNLYYKSIKSLQQENLNKKLVLIQKAEELKESEDWENTTEIMKKIQSDWKEIGHVPKNVSDKIWKQFKNSCNHYFDKLHKNQDQGKKAELEIYSQKKTYLEKIKKEISETEPTLDSIKAYISEWRNYGKVPHHVRYIEGKFNKVIDLAFGKLSMDKNEAEMFKFKNTIDGYLQQNDIRKLNGEQMFFRKKIDESVKEIQLLENNISFFSNSKTENPLIMNVLKNINHQKENLEFLKGKLKYLRSLDY